MTRKRQKSQQRKQDRKLRTEKLEDRIVFSGLTLDSSFAPLHQGNYLYEGTNYDDQIVVNFTSVDEGEITIKTTDSNGAQVGQQYPPTPFSLGELKSATLLNYGKMPNGKHPFLTIKGLAGNDQITILDNGFAQKTRFEFQVAVDGQKGNDYIQGSNFNEHLTGGKNGTTWFNTDCNQIVRGDIIYGSGGNDTIKGGAGTDYLYGNGGDDVIKGNDGNDIIEGGTGDDEIKGGDGDDVIKGGFGDDTIKGGDGDDTIYGEKGKDVIKGDSGSDYIDGGAERDLLWGGPGPDEIYGMGGNDDIHGDSNLDVGQSLNNVAGWVAGTGVPPTPSHLYDRLYGGDGNDNIWGDSGPDHIEGGKGNDIIEGGSGWDYLNGGDDDDSIHGDSGRDIIEGGIGNDYLYGDSGQDTIYGNAGNDWLQGGGGTDELHGGANDDHLWGGYDTIGLILYGDRLWGESGNDTFHKNKFGPAGFVDKIKDKQSGEKVDNWIWPWSPWKNPLV